MPASLLTLLLSHPWESLPLWEEAMTHIVLHVKLDAVDTPSTVFAHGKRDRGECINDTPIGASYTPHDDGLFEVHVFRPVENGVCFSAVDTQGRNRSLDTPQSNSTYAPSSIFTDKGGRMRPLTAYYPRCSACWDRSNMSFTFCHNCDVYASARLLIEDRLFLSTGAGSFLTDAERCISTLSHPYSVLSVEDVAEYVRISIGAKEMARPCF